ncbi:hypothetical protein TWF569_001225 [Orbilia oligospora]|uniref:DASH complex subunit SPC34 n=1 Tax=Orbilia oligospora TaxID=2813651 RepID=A0A7C8N3U6_ORBOL|nr:hypothetical protein TWF706_002392 [Orbilia oligospora]KAF3081097.1 hypothetical protein TWF706_002392 [Orbilia oligospora]KAF3082457.1 hypothetical protein TWF103_003333 [Orbilia oligospora]KAF3084210.1 hypothetical protein TWF102_000449 [Orbilia oligospora]KAF3122078.1 hypothetical protein TWF594_002921 [Orbilia oligospora]
MTAMARTMAVRNMVVIVISAEPESDVSARLPRGSEVHENPRTEQPPAHCIALHCNIMSILNNKFERHLSQIEEAANDISSMRFSKPGIFTNSQVARPPITSLIRDTSPYERVLFSSTLNEEFTERPSALPAKSGLLGSLLDGNFVHQVQSTVKTAQLKGDVDVEMLLQGAEDLARIYPIPGLDERIEQLRSRYQDLFSSVALHEELVAAQRAQLDLQRGTTKGGLIVHKAKAPKATRDTSTKAEIQDEEIAIGQLEVRKFEMESEIRELDRRLTGPISKAF